MIKFRAAGPEHEVIGFGLSHENLDRLRAGKPIRIDLSEMIQEPGESLAMENGVILIFAAADDRALFEIVEPVIGDGTVTHHTDPDGAHREWGGAL